MGDARLPEGVASERHHSAAGAGRAGAVDPPVWDLSAERRQMLELKTLSEEMLEVLGAAVRARISI
jgi:hypothetical protein